MDYKEKRRYYAQRRQAIAEAYRAGVPVPTISKETGLSRNRIYQILIKEAEPARKNFISWRPYIEAIERDGRAFIPLFGREKHHFRHLIYVAARRWGLKVATEYDDNPDEPGFWVAKK